MLLIFGYLHIFIFVKWSLDLNTVVLNDPYSVGREMPSLLNMLNMVLSPHSLFLSLFIIFLFYFLFLSFICFLSYFVFDFSLTFLSLLFFHSQRAEFQNIFYGGGGYKFFLFSYERLLVGGEESEMETVASTINNHFTLFLILVLFLILLHSLHWKSEDLSHCLGREQKMEE